MEEGCAQEQKRVALGRGHQDAEAIDAARQAPPPTLSNPLRFLPPSRYLSLSLFISLSISSRDRYLRSSPPSSPPHYVSIYVWMHLKQRRRGKSSQAFVQHVDAPHSGLGISCFPRGFWILRYASTVEMNTYRLVVRGRVIKIEGGRGKSLSRGEKYSRNYREFFL